MGTTKKKSAKKAGGERRESNPHALADNGF